MMQVRGGARSARLELPRARARLEGYRRNIFLPGPGPHPIALRDQISRLGTPSLPQTLDLYHTHLSIWGRDCHQK